MYIYIYIPSQFVRMWELQVTLPSNLSNNMTWSPNPCIGSHFREHCWIHLTSASLFWVKWRGEDHLRDRRSASGNLFGEGCGEHLPCGDLSWWWAFGLYGSYAMNAGDPTLNLRDFARTSGPRLCFKMCSSAIVCAFSQKIVTNHC